MLKPLRNVRAFLDQGNSSKTSQHKLPDYKTISLRKSPEKSKAAAKNKMSELLRTYGMWFSVRDFEAKVRGGRHLPWGETEEEEEERERAKMLC